MEKKCTLIYIKSIKSPFIDADQRILEKTYHIIPFQVNQSKNKINYILRLVNLVFFILKNLHHTKVLTVWFADYDAAIMVFLGKLFNRKTVIFAGGQEAVCYKDIRKGVYLKWFRGNCVRFALRNASLVIPNHKSLIYHENFYYNQENPHIDGIRHYVKNLKCEIQIVNNGIDDSRIIRDFNIQKQKNLILTVGNMSQIGDFYNKGFDLYIELARRNPDLEFILISIKKQFLDWSEINYGLSKIPNLTVFSEFSDTEVLNMYYNKANVYIQASITEGMPVSLGEAMLCECIPVGSNVNGIPDAIGENGVIVYHRNIDELELAVKKALQLDCGPEAREYVLNNFSYRLREKKLTEVFKNL